MRQPLSTLLILLSVFCTLSCASKKSLTKAPIHEAENLSSLILNDIFNAERPEWFEGKARLSFKENGKTAKATLYLRQKHDSLNWMVFKKLSVEAARSLITQDSMCIIYRMEKAYECSKLDSLGHIFGFEAELDFISDISLGRLPEIDSSKLWEQADHGDYMAFRSMHNDIVLDFNYDKNTALLNSGKFYDRFGRTGSWTYSDYRMINGLALPFQREFHINFANSDSLSLDIEFIEMETNVPREIRFSIPGHYEKIK